MRLPDREIAGCITDIGFNFTAADLQSPKPRQIQLILEWFVSLLLNATPETIEPAMRAAAEDLCGEYADVFSNAYNVIGFWGSLRKVLVACGVNDFTLNDLSKPTYERVAKVFSYLINFVRFRESQTNVIDEHFNKTAAMRSRIERLYSENHDNQARLEKRHCERNAAEKQVLDRSRRNDELKVSLLQLRDTQREVAERLMRMKSNKHALSESVAQKHHEMSTLQQENNRLRSYMLEAPSTLSNRLIELRKTLDNDRIQIEALDRRTRALQTSADSFVAASTDVAACIKILDEIGAELHNEKKEMEQNAKQHDALSESGRRAREVELTEQMLRKQLSKWVERTEKLREQSGQKACEAREKMQQLRAMHKRLTTENAERTEAMEIQRVRIEQTEKKMVNLKANLESEVHAAYDEYLKMDAHIKLYIAEMEKAIGQ